ncbi:hypothetical protein [Limosilactobacillus ingluviei]|uniref:hypothetical protein n=1 Tax=Limosilactobacillus ingluviei TaxID=148604 RepID=UPI000704FCD6|nr:hypothetical protein [Limosilactobacillus ingluviei]
MQNNLETELRSGVSRFSAYGKVSISADTFPTDAVKAASGYTYKRVSFPVSVGDNNTIYVQMMGGYSPKKPVIYARNTDNDPIEVNWDLRTNENILENIADRSFVKVRLEKDADGKLIEKKFLSEFDAITYMADHLKDGQQVYIGGDVEYRHYNGQIQRSFNMTTVALDENEDRKPSAQLSQTYLIDNTSVDSDWEDQLEEKKQLVVNAYVPQYVGKHEGKQIKKTLAFPQQFVLKATDENMDKRKAIVKRFLLTDEDVVRELSLLCDLVDGYEESTGNVELSDDLKELIKLGFMTEEAAEKQMTIGGNRVRETVLVRPMLRRNNGQPELMMEDKYAPEALVFLQAIMDDEEVDDPFPPEDETAKSTESKDENVTTSFEDDINAMFS